MSDLWPIYVPSRGRAGISKTLQRLQDEGLYAIWVVEPHEAEAYGLAYPKLGGRVLPESNRGLMYSRNEIVSWHPGLDGWFWMIDDDISAFHRFEGTKGKQVTAREALLAAQEEARPGVGQIALEYQQFAWSAGGKVKVNSYCDVCVGIKNGLPIKYRQQLKHDRDYTMQVIASGLDTRRVTRYAFSTPSIGSNKGGLHELYQANKDASGAKELEARWPWCVEVQTKKSGRVDAKIHWRRVRQKYALT